jgi:hypothetical protein
MKREGKQEALLSTGIYTEKRALYLPGVFCYASLLIIVCPKYLSLDEPFRHGRTAKGKIDSSTSKKCCLERSRGRK